MAVRPTLARTLPRSRPTVGARLVSAAVLAAIVAVVPAFTGTAGATRPGLPTIQTLACVTGLPARATRDLTEPLTSRVELVGVTWRAGHPQVGYRWRTGSAWSPWRQAADDSTAPNAAERRRARPGTEPLWRPTGANAVEVRIRSGPRQVTGVRLLAVVDPADSLVRRVLDAARPQPTVAEAATGFRYLGQVLTRADWGADESLRRCGPDYADRVRAVIVHHTDQSSDYSPGDVPRMIRADYAYHVRGRGWCDLGYNLLVDRFGRIWQGRAGGIGRAVIGAHAAGFNTATLGVAYLGTTDHDAPPAAALAAFSRVAAFAGHRWRFNPTGWVTLTSDGSPRYGPGVRVRLHRVIGHRDVGRTDCPGRLLYADLGAIRRAAYQLLDPAPPLTFTAVDVTGNPVHYPSPVTVALTLSRSAKWEITISDGGGDVLADVTGNGTSAEMSWDGAEDLLGTGAQVPVPPQMLTWKATAQADGVAAAPRTGEIDVGTPVH